MLDRDEILSLICYTPDEPAALRAALHRALNGGASGGGDLCAALRNAFGRGRFRAVDVVDAATSRTDLREALRAARVRSIVAVHALLTASPHVRQHTWCRFSVPDSESKPPPPLGELVAAAAEATVAGPCAHGRALRAVVVARGDSRAALAEFCGLDYDTCANRLALADLARDVADAVDAAFFTWRAGERRRAITPDQQRAVLRGLTELFPRGARGSRAQDAAVRLRDAALAEIP